MALKNKFDSAKFVILAEMEPPKGVDASAMISHAKRVKDRVDAFLVPEMNHAVMRMSALGGAMLLQREGMETIMQICCRDRNRLALQGDLLAAGACGVPNIAVVDGEDPSFGDHHQARPVHDINTIELLNAIQGLMRGKDLAGVEINGPPDFLTGSITNAGARGRSAEIEVEELQRRTDAGARFFVTPPIFDPELIKPFLQRINPQRTILVPTVLLLKSLGMARYMERNMPHIFLPPAIIDRIQRAPDKVRECVRIAVELAGALRFAGFAGVMLSTLGWEHKLADIVEAL
jgi:5,10-methylenetetrahydrofolate reductase